MIYKIVNQPQWSEFQRAGVFTGSAVDLADGFIHFSNADQVAQTAAKHFAGQEDLVIFCIDETTLQPHLKFEPSRGGDLFPHLYADLQLTDVVQFWPLPWNPGTQTHELPVDVI